MTTQRSFSETSTAPDMIKAVTWPKTCQTVSEKLQSHSAAFFDVDETLIAVKSMFRFLKFYLDQAGEPPGTYHRLINQLHRLADNGAPREYLNRAYYRIYAGEDAGTLAAAGHAWYRLEQADGALFLPTTRDEYAAHRAVGRFTGLVSGSFFACLDPIAEALDASIVIASAPHIRRGRLTGEITTPMIGQAKADAVRTITAAHGIDPATCYAYADHASDLAMLRSVGHPVVVGDDPVLRKHARQHGWRRLPGLPSPAVTGSGYIADQHPHATSHR